MTASIMQVVGYKNSGKTTLVERLVEALTEAGCRVGTVKRDAHEFEVDHAGTDSWRHRRAGAAMTAITSAARTAVMEERHTPLSELLQRMAQMDVVLVEGFKHEPYPKIVIARRAEDEELVRQLDHVAAVVTWMPDREREYGGGGVPYFSITDTGALIEWLLARVRAAEADADAGRRRDTPGPLSK